MLQHLSISRYALIEQLEIDFQDGFSVITGETGAGKSIILGALSLLLGGKADAKAIRTGEKKCTIEAVFTADQPETASLLRSWDIDHDPAGCIVRREVNENGKSRAFINDTPVPVARLKELGGLLIDIHSQHQNLLIRNEHFLLDTLDLNVDGKEIIENYRHAFTDWHQAEAALKSLKEKAEKEREEEEYIRFRLGRLEEAALQEGEQETLEQEARLLGNAEEIQTSLHHALSLLSVEEESLSRRLRQAGDALGGVEKEIPEAKSLGERLNTLRIELDDIEADIDRLTDRIIVDPARLAFVEERLDTIYELERKNRVQTVKELITLKEALSNELSLIEHADEEIERLEKHTAELLSLLTEAAARLTAARLKAGERIVNSLTESLHLLGMPHGKLAFEFTPRTCMDIYGADNVTFLFSANKNVPPRDVSMIASGGEIARLMLALKAELARHTAMPTIIFDEIDTGVSGTMAEKMAEVMKSTSTRCQVICITHLPQIAALGDHHFRVYKDDRAESTLSHIVPLSSEERITEIAHMLSGATLTPAAIENAKALLRLSQTL